MNRRDYNHIAQVIGTVTTTMLSDPRDSLPLSIDPGHADQFLAAFVHNLADGFASSNQNFDRARFLRACGQPSTYPSRHSRDWPDVDDAIRHWAAVFHATSRYALRHTRQEWAAIADAVRIADVWAQNAPELGHPMDRGDPTWCGIADDSYHILVTQAASASANSGHRSVCYAEEHIIRTWLDAPSVLWGSQLTTTARSAGLQDDFDPTRRPDPASLIRVVDNAQEAGAFGIPGRRIGLWLCAEDGPHRRDSYLVTLRPPHGPALASPPVPADHLVHDGQTATDAIVAVLQGVARVAGDLLNASAAAATESSPGHWSDRGPAGSVQTPPAGPRRGISAPADLGALAALPSATQPPPAGRSRPRR